MPDILIDNLTSGRQLTLRLSGSNPNFQLQSERIAAAALHDLEPSALDLPEVAAAVFYADSEIPRGGDTRPHMGSNWRRKLRIAIPVRLPDLWRRPEVRQCLTETVRFMTDDEVEFVFRARSPAELSDGFLDLDPDGTAFRADEVILFSGGLDSFAGALETLSTSASTVLLVSHRSAPKVFPRQDRLAEWLSKRFKGRVRHVKVGATRKGQESHDTTQRSRSFLFAAIGHAVSQAFGSKRLSFFENGVVSHNLPISSQVVGTMATRTTHPRTIDLLNQLIEMIAPDTTRVTNAYAWMTKRDVVERIAEYDGNAMIRTAVSCTHVRDQTTLHTHCGTCSQCLDRRFAILAAGLEAHDPSESYGTDVLFGPRDGALSRTLAVEWMRHALRLSKIDEQEFMQSFGMEISSALQAGPPEHPEDQFRRIVEMHRRHGTSVEKVLEQAISSGASDLARKVYPANSLVRLWLSDPSEHTKPKAKIVAPAPFAPQPFEMAIEADDQPSPTGPWTARFLHDGDIHVVIVERLGRVTGAPARMALLLKVVWIEDKFGGLLIEDHRFVHLHTLGAVSKEAAKNNVSRFRKTLSEAYTAIYGLPPKRHLVIESNGKKGHRLDPETKVIDKP